MPDKKGRMTPQERVFVKEFAGTGNAVYAAEKAGYRYPHQSAHHALARPSVQGEVRRQQMARLENEVLPLCVNTLVRVLSDPNEPSRTQLMAAKIGIDAFKSMGVDQIDTPLQEKSAAELRAMLDVVETRLAELAVDVTPGEVEEGSAQGAPNIFD